MTIDEMKLEAIAEAAAKLLLQRHPNIQFTSGRRDVTQQAHAIVQHRRASRPKMDRQDLPRGGQTSGMGRQSSQRRNYRSAYCGSRGSNGSDAGR